MRRGLGGTIGFRLNRRCDEKCFPTGPISDNHMGYGEPHVSTGIEFYAPLKLTASCKSFFLNRGSR